MSKKHQKTPEAQEPVEEQAAVETEVTDETPAETPAPEAPAASEEIEKLRMELRVEKEKYLRLMAEYDNFRKRSAKEREALFADVRSDTVTKFLPVYDNLVRALAQPTTDEAYSKGVQMIMTQFNTVLEKMGVTEIEALGQTFDPQVHNAVMHIEDESFGKEEIVEEFEKGFKLGEKVIRYSVVKVAN